MRTTRSSPCCACGGAVSEVATWRRHYLAALGLPGDVVAAVVADDRFDVRALLALLERGCPPELAVRILAPAGQEGGR